MNNTIASNTVIDAFGDDILSTSCGSNIVDNFYDDSNPMLMTAETMGRLAIQNVVEFMAFAMIAIIVQTLFAIYFKACRDKCCECCNYVPNDTEKSYRKLCRFHIVLSSFLAICVFINFLVEISHYYQFVNSMVKFDADEIDNFYSVEECEEEGIGKLVCPVLFDDCEYVSCGYSVSNAATTCKWLFWLLLPSNPHIFQYSFLLSFVFVEAMLYYVLMSGLCCCAWMCNCWAWFSCWCCCIYTINNANTSCCPQPVVCCDAINCCRGCNVCSCCSGCNWSCCYCCCGCFGMLLLLLLWIIDVVLTLIIIGVVCSGFGIGFMIVIIGFGLTGFILISLITFPIIYCYGRSFCPHIAASFCAIIRGRTYLFASHTFDDGLPFDNACTGAWYYDLETAMTGIGRMKYCSNLVTVFSSLLNIVIIVFIQILLSIFLIYFIVDNRPFWVWEMFMPSFIGFFDSYHLITQDYVNDVISNSLSWYAVIGINSSFEKIKYSILFIRMLFHIVTGIIDVITATEPYIKKSKTVKTTTEPACDEETVELEVLVKSKPEPSDHDTPNKTKIKSTSQCGACKNTDAVRVSKILFDQLDGSLFDNKHDLCYCINCHNGRIYQQDEKEVYQRGDPPKTYALPIGWMRFGLKTENEEIFNGWHVAFHGTKQENIEKIFESGLKLLKPGDRAADGHIIEVGDGHIQEPFKRYNEYTKETEMFDPIQIYCSPSIKYCAYPAYAKEFFFKLRDANDNSKAYNVQVAFQLRIKPGTYQIGQETIGAERRNEIIDQHFSNSELEWYTKQNDAIVLYGLLIRLQDVD